MVYRRSLLARLLFRNFQPISEAEAEAVAEVCVELAALEAIVLLSFIFEIRAAFFSGARAGHSKLFR